MNSTKEVLQYILYTYYLNYFQKNINNTSALINFSIKVNTITFTYNLTLGL